MKCCKGCKSNKGYNGNKSYNSCNKKCCNIESSHFNAKKENVLGSLYEVESFLCKLNKIVKGIKIYSLFK